MRVFETASGTGVMPLMRRAVSNMYQETDLLFVCTQGPGLLVVVVVVGGGTAAGVMQLRASNDRSYWYAVIRSEAMRM